MEFRKNIIILLKHCIDNSAVDSDETTGYGILTRITENKWEELKNIVRIINSANFAVEQLYSYDKFIEIFDRKGLSGFVKFSA